jgi:hypothetical protein
MMLPDYYNDRTTLFVANLYNAQPYTKLPAFIKCAAKLLIKMLVKLLR